MSKTIYDAGPVTTPEEQNEKSVKSKLKSLYVSLQV